VTHTAAVIASAAMLIRRPVAEVFAAFVEPERTSKFWFTSGSGSLEEGKRVEWTWDKYGFTVPVDVKTVEDNRRIVVEWPGYGTPTTIEWHFTARPDDTTYVSITNSGFSGDAGEVAKQAVSATEGFAYVLAALKALLEHGVSLNLGADKFPDGLPEATS
jgi:uncharacterized protein YndB with AHSA1/START domain